MKISEQAKLKKSPVEQINAVTSLLSEDVRYNGDWRTVKGAFHPRSLEVISKSGYGDCKDFTVAAGAILRTLGFEAHAAWTNRGFDVMERPYNLPVLGFNHAILHVKKDEKEYWIDPTNFASFAQGVPDDIENKLAIILKPSGAVKARTEAGKSEDKFNKVVLNLNFDKDSLITGTGEIVLKGASSFSMTGAELNGSKQSTEYSLLKWALNESNISSWGFEPYSLKSRIVKDVTTSFKFTFPWFPVLTSAGKGFLVSLPPDVPSLVTNRAQRVSYLNFQGSPYRIVREYHIKGRSVAMESEFDCQGSSQWADFSRKFIKNGSDVVLVDDFSLKVRTISPEDISTKLYGDFQEKLRSCMQRAVVVFRPN
ncbi:MAG: transglutaminase domain-containing protein [Bdellovibrio sp.]|nr:transglutaminase domain-containing protein [Bdellovibrio sp.]